MPDKTISLTLNDTCLPLSKGARRIKDDTLTINEDDLISVHLIESQNVLLILHKSIDDDGVRDSSDALWKVLKKNLVHDEINAQSWWITTGSLLAILLRKANYQLEAQCDILLFYFAFIAPELGPSLDLFGRFPRWKSFMTDDGTPLEMSWEWGLGDSPPIVRLSIEPIGLTAGTPQDPLNQFATNRVVENVQHVSSTTDLRLYHYFSKELISYNVGHESKDAALATTAHQSRSFVAFDFGKTSNLLKAYFVPTFKAKETRQSALSLVTEAVAKLAKLEALHFPAYDLLLDYIQTSSEGSQLEAEMLAVDCVSPASSRIKVYLRSRSTSFKSVLANMTLNGELRQRNLDSGIMELAKLWNSVLLPTQHLSANEELPHSDHRTAGILYYYEFRHGKSIPTPRLYIPVRHYGQNDMAVAEGLVGYLRSRGQGEMAGWFWEALQSA